MPSEDEKSTSSNSGAFCIAQNGDSDQEKSDDISLPAHVAGSGSLIAWSTPPEIMRAPQLLTIR